MPDRKQPTALFVADSHFHVQPDAAERNRLIAFLRLLQASRGVDHLFLLGDVFDFWFDYPHFQLRGYDELLQALDEVRDSGTKLHFVGGNHDIWAADYFHRRYGCDPSPEHRIVRLGDVNVRISHGDGLLGRDWVYNTFRRIVRTRAGIVFAKSLHPEVLFAFSTWLSHTSRQATRQESSEIEEQAHEWLAKKAAGEWDLMVIGHVHHGFDIRAHGYRMAALPGWLSEWGYGLLQDGEFSLRRWPEDELPGF